MWEKNGFVRTEEEESFKMLGCVYLRSKMMYVFKKKMRRYVIVYLSALDRCLWLDWLYVLWNDLLIERRINWLIYGLDSLDRK